MAFGSFNKAKVLAAAEKFVTQGKIPNAIHEYQKILEQDPRDLVVLNTVGDLHLRINKTAEALTYFYKLGEAYVEDGFVRNGIAVYKKISRSDANSIEAITRLADLYTLQGQLNEARTHLNQAVEYYSQRKDTEKCIELFEKLLLLEPDNVQAKQRLAVVYEQAGKKADAAAMYLNAAEGFADRANPAEADKALQKARDLGMNTVDAVILQARIQVESGRGPEAIATLGAIPDVETNRAALNLLFHAHMNAGDVKGAAQAAAIIFDRFEDFAGLEQATATLIERGEVSEAMSTYERVLDRLVAQRGTAVVVEGLKTILQQDKENLRARRLLCRTYEAAGETGEFTDASEQLADILVQQQQYQEAHEVYSKLARMEPANPMHRQRLQQVSQRLGLSSALLADLPEAEPAITIEDPIVGEALSQSEQQANFHQIDRAIEILEQALGQAQGNARLNERLVTLYEREQRWAQAAAACDALVEAHVIAGDGERATHFGDLSVKFHAMAEAAPNMAATAPPPQEFAVPEFAPPEFDVPAAMPMGMEEMQSPEPPPMSFTMPEAPTPPENETREVDLSGEWESMMGAEPEPAPSAPDTAEADALVQETESYLRTNMVSEASLSLATLRSVAPHDPRLGDLESRVEQAVLGVPLTPDPEPEPAPMPMPIPLPAFTLPETSSESAFHLAAEPEPEPIPAMPDWPAETPAMADWPVETPATSSASAFDLPAMAAQPTPPPPPPVAHEDDFSLELEHEAHATAHEESFELSLEVDDMPALRPKSTPPPIPKPAPPPAPPVKPAPPAKPGKPGKPGLADVFAEFKEEMEQDSAADADIENHYNMGIAFKEMGLFDEAIGEFQKAYHAAERTPDNPNFIGVCTLLAHCFQAKKHPELAVKWLQNALRAQGLDADGEMALRYEIGAAQELAGLKPAALESFLQVYAINIDYRDVADRIRALKGA